MDSIKVETDTMTQFYKGTFDVWKLFRQDTTSLYFLLWEPLVHGARLDVACETTPGLSRFLYLSKTLKLQSLKDIGGPELSK